MSLPLHRDYVDFGNNKPLSLNSKFKIFENLDLIDYLQHIISYHYNTIDITDTDLLEPLDPGNLCHN